MYRYRELSCGGTSGRATGRLGARSAYTGAWSEPCASIQMSLPVTAAWKPREASPHGPAARMRSMRVP